MIRNVIIPMLWAVILGLIFGAALWFSAPSHADPYDPAADYAAENHNAAVAQQPSAVIA